MNKDGVFYRFRSFFFLITYAIVLFVFLTNLEKFGSISGYITSILSPVLLGCGMAFVLNLPMSFFERKVFGPFCEKHPKCKSLKKPLSLIFTLLLFFSVLATFISFFNSPIIPKLDAVKRHNYQ